MVTALAGRGAIEILETPVGREAVDSTDAGEFAGPVAVGPGTFAIFWISITEPVLFGPEQAKHPARNNKSGI
jgi:hypothetical protein